MLLCLHGGCNCNTGTSLQLEKTRAGKRNLGAHKLSAQTASVDHCKPISRLNMNLFFAGESAISSAISNMKSLFPSLMLLANTHIGSVMEAPMSTHVDSLFPSSPRLSTSVSFPLMCGQKLTLLGCLSSFPLSLLSTVG